MALTQVQSQMIGGNSSSIPTTTSLGNGALNSNSAANNTAVGYQAAYTNSTGTFLTAVGYQAAYTSNNAGTTCAIGHAALYNNTTGEDNTAVGSYRPLFSNTTGSQNTAIGRQSLYSNTTASNNTAVGYQAGYSNTTGFGNVLVGNYAGYSSVTANYQTAFGYGSLQTATGGSNTGLGVFALNAVTTGTNNTGVGPSAGSALTSGSNNTYVGGFSGNGNGLDLRTRSYNVGLSMGNGSLRYLSLDMGTVSTTTVDIGPNEGIGGLHFVTAYNLSGGAQGWWLIATRTGSVTIVASSNNTGLTITFGQSGSTRLNMTTSSGSVAGNCHNWVDS